MVIKPGMLFKTVPDDNGKVYFYIVDWVDKNDVGYHNIGLNVGTAIDQDEFVDNFEPEWHGHHWEEVSDEEAYVVRLLYGEGDEKDE
jgi:hypothetical protein